MLSFDLGFLSYPSYVRRMCYGCTDVVQPSLVIVGFQEWSLRSSSLLPLDASRSSVNINATVTTSIRFRKPKKKQTYTHGCEGRHSLNGLLKSRCTREVQNHCPALFGKNFRGR
jgi:hypothetical protein